MPSTQLLNHFFNLVCLLCAVWAALPQGVLDGCPPRVKAAIATGAGVLMWLKSNRNLFQNPDGTPAKVPYNPPDKPAQ